MSAPRLMQINFAPVAEIDARHRLRPVSDAGVESLIASIRETGVMKDAIHVRQKKGGALVLIAGAHRLEAARRLGWAEIEAKVWADVTDDWARLMEIDDSLAGAEMGPLDTAVFLATRKAIYERLHPETRRGIAGAAARWDATDTMSVAFVTATAEKFGLAERSVYRLVAAGSALTPKDVSALRAAPRPVTLKDLAEIAKCSAVERYDVVEMLRDGEARSVAEARRRLAPPAPGGVEDPIEAALKALKTAWTRAPREARRRFARDHADDLQALIHEGVPE